MDNEMRKRKDPGKVPFAEAMDDIERASMDAAQERECEESAPGKNGYEEETKPRYNRASYRKKVRSINKMAGAFRAKNNERAMKAKARAARKASHRVYAFRADA